MDFGTALQKVKDGGKAARSGWNGKGMFIFLGLPRIYANYETSSGIVQHSDSAEHYGIHYQSTGCLAMKTAQNEIQVGWVASQSDMLADDWQIVD